MTIWAPRIKKNAGPRYQAIAEALSRDIRKGTLKPGTRLPTHRSLADRLGVTVGTVSRAYAEADRRGLISGQVGRGTFVRSLESGRSPLRADWSDPEQLTPLDLSMNVPADPLVSEPGSILATTLDDLSNRGDLSSLLQYQPHVGTARHRKAGADWIGRTGLDARPEQVVVCSGSQHAMAVVFATLTQPGDIVLTEALTYPGMKSLARVFHLELRGLAIDEHGIRPQAFEEECRNGRVRALYCVPTIQNPTGSVMPAERRKKIAAIARAHDVAIVEDDVHGLIPPTPPPPISSYAPERSYYIGNTSKCIAPGLRIGYLLAPEGSIERLAASLWSMSWMAAPLMAEIAAIWITDRTADRLLHERREEAVARQEIAREILGHLRYDAHPSGYHLWLHLPDPWRADDFIVQSRRRGVAVTPPTAFVVGRGTAPHAVRLCLGAAPGRDKLRRALSALRELLEQPPEPSLSIV